MILGLENKQIIGPYLGGPGVEVTNIICTEYMATYSRFQKPHRKGHTYNFFEWDKAQRYLEQHPF